MGRFRLLVLVTTSLLLTGCLLRGGSATLADLEVAYNGAQDAIEQAESLGADEGAPQVIELAKNRLEEVREKQLAAPSQDVLREYRYVKTLAQRAVNQTLRSRLDQLTSDMSGFDEPSTDTVVYKVPQSSDELSLDKEPIAYWSFDGDTGYTVKDEIGSFNGKRVGYTQKGMGVEGRALILEDENGWVEVSESASLSLREAFTISLWFYPTRQQKQVLITKGGLENPANPFPFSMYLTQNGDIVFSANTEKEGFQLRSVGYNLRRWHHVVGRFDGTTLELYVNGEKISGVPTDSTLLTNDQPLVLGSDAYGRKVLQGRLDEVHLYDEALSEASILKLYKRIR